MLAAGMGWRKYAGEMLKIQENLQIKGKTLRNERRELQKRNRPHDSTYFDKFFVKNLDFFIDAAQKRKETQKRKEVPLPLIDLINCASCSGFSARSVFLHQKTVFLYSCVKKDLRGRAKTVRMKLPSGSVAANPSQVRAKGST